jgi:hypothetical protein
MARNARTTRRSPAPVPVPVIRWGAGTSNDELRQCARCTACGYKGATVQHPGWGAADIGFLPFSDAIWSLVRTSGSRRPCACRKMFVVMTVALLRATNRSIAALLNLQHTSCPNIDLILL